MNAIPVSELVQSLVKNLKSGDDVLHFLILKSKELRKARSGIQYVDLLLGDRSGVISGKMWSNAVKRWGLEFIPGDCVKVEGRVETYRDQNQIIIEKIRKARDSEVAYRKSLIKCTEKDTDALLNELITLAEGLQPEGLGLLVSTIIRKYGDRLKLAPAAKIVHHAYEGGLIEHICSVVQKIESILVLEPRIHRGQAIAGAILHDIGKILELDSSGEGRTIEGRLLGHIILGSSMIRDEARSLGLEHEPWLLELEHIILSHHGEPGFGSPVLPMTLEAVLVHFMDNLDAKLKIMTEALESCDDSGFAPYNKWLNTRVYTGSSAKTQEDPDAGN